MTVDAPFDVRGPLDEMRPLARAFKAAQKRPAYRALEALDRARDDRREEEAPARVCPELVTSTLLNNIQFPS